MHDIWGTGVYRSDLLTIGDLEQFGLADGLLRLLIALINYSGVFAESNWIIFFYTVSLIGVFYLKR